MSKSSGSSSTSSTLKRKVQVSQQTPPPVAPTSVKQIKKDTTIEKPKVFSYGLVLRFRISIMIVLL